MDLTKLFKPNSIAIVGVSHEAHKVGHLVAKNCITQGFTGNLSLINNKYQGEILGKPVYSTLTEAHLLHKVDLVVLAVPASVALHYLDEMKQLHIHHAVIFAAGFKEIGTEGMDREKQLLQKAKENEIVILGPNCLGFVNTIQGINLTFLKHICPKGNIGFISQSGALGSMMVDHYVSHKNLGFSYFISMGNKSIIDESDALEFLYNDKHTDVIAMYLEDVKDGDKFKKTLQKITKSKPIVILKSGSTSEGSKAAVSHTGGMVGDDQVFDAIFKQYGVIRASNLTEFLTILRMFSFHKDPISKNVLVLSNAGGMGVLLTDELVKNNLHLVTISQKTKLDLQKRMDDSSKISIHNPIDLLGDASAFSYDQAIQATMKEEDVGCIVVLLTPQANTEIHKTAKAIAQAQAHFEKPIYPMFMGEHSIEGSHLFFEDLKIASFYKFDYFAPSISKILKWKEYKTQNFSQPEETHILRLSLMANEAEIQTILQQNKGKQYLNLVDSLDVLRFIDLPVAPYFVGELNADVKKIAHKVGFPCVLKIISEKITHKTEVGGVIANISSVDTLEKAVEKIKKIPDVDSMLIQKMEKGFEMFIGTKRDPIFGIVLVIGLGGIYAELLKDITYRVFPFSYEEFIQMLSETKLSQLVRGYRGGKVADVKKVYDIIVKVGLLMEQYDQIKEIDLNPLMITDSSMYVVDGRIVF